MLIEVHPWHVIHLKLGIMDVIQTIAFYYFGSPGITESPLWGSSTKSVIVVFSLWGFLQPLRSLDFTVKLIPFPTSGRLGVGEGWGVLYLNFSTSLGWVSPLPNTWRSSRLGSIQGCFGGASNELTRLPGPSHTASSLSQGQEFLSWPSFFLFFFSFGLLYPPPFFFTDSLFLLILTIFTAITQHSL